MSHLLNINKINLPYVVNKLYHGYINLTLSVFPSPTPLYHSNIPHYINLTLSVFHGPNPLYHGSIPYYIKVTIPVFYGPTPLYHGNIPHPVFKTYKT